MNMKKPQSAKRLRNVFGCVKCILSVVWEDLAEELVVLVPITAIDWGCGILSSISIPFAKLNCQLKASSVVLISVKKRFEKNFSGNKHVLRYVIIFEFFVDWKKTWIFFTIHEMKLKKIDLSRFVSSSFLFIIIIGPSESVLKRYEFDSTLAKNSK